MPKKETKGESKEKNPENNTLLGLNELLVNDQESIRTILEDLEKNIQKLKHILLTGEHKKLASKLNLYDDKNGKIIEGIFDGENMIAPDGKKFPVPSNYSSKSKLISGDLLKLTVTSDGSFVFKQIGPIERKKIIGVLQESNGRYFVSSENKNYNVLLASVTYYKIKVGDKVTIIVPRDAESDWAAIENVIDSNKK